MKRGLLYIDWAISIGIFIIYLVALFVFVAPALSDEYSEDYLKTIARTGFEENAYHTLYVYPIFIKNDVIEVSSLKLDTPSNLDLSDPSKVGIFDANFQPITTTYVDQSSITFDPGSISGGGTINTFYMIISNSNENYFHNGPSEGILPDDYAFGVPEIYYGLSESKVIELFSLSYNNFKARLKYPESKNLAIDIYGLPSIGNSYSIVPDTITNNETVYVSQWSTWMLNTNSQKSLRTISIQTW